MSSTAAAPVDPIFPSLHIRPRTGWLNDPNGVSLVDGRYHVFFQYNPGAPTHGDIAWGHVSSDDLLHWREEPLALVPRVGKIDAAGCWSGCVVDDGGVPTAVYSAVPDHAWNAAVVLARSDRSMVDWVQDEVPQMPHPTDPDIAEVRDPFVFTFEGHRYAVQGAGQQQGEPRILAYACDDLNEWAPLGSLLTFDDPIAAEVAPANIWECPNLFYLDGTWVLLVSMWRWIQGTHSLAGVQYLIGDLQRDADGLRFIPTRGGSVDDGATFYAPQVLSTGDRALLWGWAFEQDRTEAQVAAAGWAGVLTFPRELRVVDGRLVSSPAAELVRLRQQELAWQPGDMLTETSFEVESQGPLSLVLVDGRIQQTVAELTKPARVLVDGSMIEIFTGEMATTTRAYPGSNSFWELRARADDVTLYRLALPAEQ